MQLHRDILTKDPDDFGFRGLLLKDLRFKISCDIITTGYVDNAFRYNGSRERLHKPSN